MIESTINWSLFQTENGTKTAEDLGIPENQDLPLKAYLQDLKRQKKRFTDGDVTHIAVYHTVFYEGQCNTEFDPEIISLLHNLKATFCVTCQSV
ncbi:MAG: hypothetical protein U5L45_18405 [Saprospiraceae bacterium]|nr:hypothetical protein [Saprospiraceae bacterium]